MDTEKSIMKTLIIIEMKSGNEKRIESPEDILKLIRDMVLNEGFGKAIGFNDIDGSFLILNTSEFETITLIPQVQDATS